MSDNLLKLNVGTRSSKLAVAQANGALQKLTQLFPILSCQLVPMSSPGDEDRSTSLEKSEPDFFTRYLDNAVENGELDCAIHSAKDLPGQLPSSLEWFWLPWREDQRDAIVLRQGENIGSLPKNLKIGISSERRRAYCQERFPGASLLSVRGNIEERLADLDIGKYDLVIIAVAALNRLGLEQRITEWIPLSDLATPEGQGTLAVTYRTTDDRIHRIRNYFIKPAVFAGGGAGHYDYCTLASWKELHNCEVCIFDALLPPELLNLLPAKVELVDAGKRQGRYTIPREKLDRLVVDLVRQSKKVVRLKGGDPGIYARLAEEVATFEEHRLPYRVIPGISSLNTATTGTGLLLTRRGKSRGFTVVTPRFSDDKNGGIGARFRERLPLVFFMAVGMTQEIADQLIAEGRSKTEPATMVFGAGSVNETIISGSLEDIAEKVERFSTTLPGLLIVGRVASTSYLYKNNYSALEGKRVLITCSERLQREAEKEILNFGGTPIRFPLIQLNPLPDAKKTLNGINRYDWVILTSPSAVYSLMTLLRESDIDVRKIPRIIVSGPGVSRALLEYGLKPDLEPEKDYGAGAMLQAMVTQLKPGQRVLRLRSWLASRAVEDTLIQRGMIVSDCTLYDNVPIHHDELPPFDYVVFSSGSAVRVFMDQMGEAALRGKTSIAIGKPTMNTMNSYGYPPTLVSQEPTVCGTIQTLAAHCVNTRLEQLTAAAVSRVD